MPNFFDQFDQTPQTALPGPQGTPQGQLPPLGAVAPPPQMAPGQPLQGGSGLNPMARILALRAASKGNVNPLIKMLTPQAPLVTPSTQEKNLRSMGLTPGTPEWNQQMRASTSERPPIQVNLGPVSYTHLTLPTIYSVQSSVGDVSMKQ